MNRLKVICSIIFLTVTTLGWSIEVGGHLIEDTVWSSENNPYLVTENIFVDSGVKLTILPGVEVLLRGAQLNSYVDLDRNFVLHGETSVAKMIQVDGQIIAEGTADAPITFNRMESEINYNWGCIYISEEAEFSVFKYCHIENAASILVCLGRMARGLYYCNGKGMISHCEFRNNSVGIEVESLDSSAFEICYNDISNDENANPFFPENNYGKVALFNGLLDFTNVCHDMSLVHNNHISSMNFARSCTTDSYFVKNVISGINMVDASNSVLFENEFNHENFSIRSPLGLNDGDGSTYLKCNRLDSIVVTVSSENGITYISDNDFFNSMCIVENENWVVFYNNIMINSPCDFNGYQKIFNNVFKDDSVISLEDNSFWFSNNLILDNFFGIASGNYTDNLVFENSIFLKNDVLSYDNVGDQEPLKFKNCIIDNEIALDEIVDLGGNIFINSLQAEEILADIENGDYHLQSGSLAIDAGEVGNHYYYPFALENSVRKWDGDGNGSPVMDIGPYEYGAVQMGKVVGYITETTTNEPVDYAIIKANNEMDYYTFTDSLGYFELQLPEGCYDFYVDRVFYADSEVYNIIVENEEDTEIAFNMTSILSNYTANDNDEIEPPSTNIESSNYPNPFNPETTIEYCIPQTGSIKLDIFNLKGQKVITLVDEFQEAGNHSIIWNGKDDSNHKVASGIYLYKLKSGSRSFTKKMVLMK